LFQRRWRHYVAQKEQRGKKLEISGAYNGGTANGSGATGGWKWLTERIVNGRLSTLRTGNTPNRSIKIWRNESILWVQRAVHSLSGKSFELNRKQFVLIPLDI
jgi:hypothetical protein